MFVVCLREDLEDEDGEEGDREGSSTKELNIVVKADVEGSIEAIVGALEVCEMEV